MIITSMFVDVIQFAETLKDHMNAIVIADMFTLIFWVQSYRRKNVVTSMNVPKPFMNAILMPLATTMTEATLVHATADTKISMVMDEIVEIPISVLLKLTNAMRIRRAIVIWYPEWPMGLFTNVPVSTAFSKFSTLINHVTM